MSNQHTIAYIGVQKISARRWIHVGYDMNTKRIVPMPKNLIPKKPEPKHP